MSLNKSMHPRNPYKDKKPDFKALASKYEEFRKHTTQDSKGRVIVDFKKPECMRALSWVLLKEDFGLDVDMPLNRLIPTVPLRLNYILWIEDLLLQRRDGVKGIDIGTGASCVYPLIAASKNKWTFVATETDDFNTEYAKRNVEKNQLQDRVTVLQVSPATRLYGAVSDDATYDFCMCNPPFFGSNLEAWGLLTSRSDDRPEPRSMSTASLGESIVTGGEVAFVKQIILDSLKLKNRVRIYTTMLGKKSSLAPLKAELQRHGISKFGTTELCQGRTMRWALGWTFEEGVVFKPPVGKRSPQKPRPLLTIKLGQPEGKDGEGSLEDVTNRVVKLLDQLEMTHKVLASDSAATKKWLVTAKHNTWSHQRRKRRQMAQLASREKLDKLENNDSCGDRFQKHESGKGGSTDGVVTNGDARTVHSESCTDKHPVTELVKGDVSAGKDVNGGQLSEGTVHSESCVSDQHPVAKLVKSGISVGGDTNGCVTTKKACHVGGTGTIVKCGGNKDTGDGEYLMKYTLVVSQQKDSVVLQFTGTDGVSYDLLHEVVQYFRNRLQ